MKSVPLMRTESGMVSGMQARIEETTERVKRMRFSKDPS
jgi:hypothetical protein